MLHAAMRQTVHKIRAVLFACFSSISYRARKIKCFHSIYQYLCVIRGGGRKKPGEFWKSWKAKFFGEIS